MLAMTPARMRSWWSGGRPRPRAGAPPVPRSAGHLIGERLQVTLRQLSRFQALPSQPSAQQVTRKRLTSNTERACQAAQHKPT